jgi:hypothetical protein
MNTIKEQAMELFCKGKDPKEVYKILRSRGVKTCKDTISVYYNKYHLKEKKSIFIKSDFRNDNEYRTYRKDSDFEKIYEFYKEGYYSGIDDNNIYIKRLKFLDGDEVAFRKTFQELKSNLSTFKLFNLVPYLDRGLEICELIDKNSECILTDKGKDLLDIIAIRNDTQKQVSQSDKKSLLESYH